MSTKFLFLINCSQQKYWGGTLLVIKLNFIIPFARSFIQGKRIIRCIFCFLFIGREPTTCLQMGVFLQITFCSLVTAGNTLLRENSRSVPQAARELFHIFTWSKKQWSNDKTIIQLCYRKMWFVSVSEINYLPQPSAWANNWSARHWQITIFCATMHNHC